MTCENIRPALIAYHFAVIDGDERVAVETHLPGCSACVRELVELKRAVELADDHGGPSDVARARLRAAIADELRGPNRRWERPLAFACALVATVMAVVATQAITEGPGAAPYELSD